MLTDDDGVGRPIGDNRTGDCRSTKLLELIEESRPRKWRRWLTFHSAYTLDAVRTQLTAAGICASGAGGYSASSPSAHYKLDRVDA